MTLADITRRLASALPTELVTNRAEPPTGPAPAAPGSGGSRGPFAAMRHRNYRLFWIGQVLSLVGTWMQSVNMPVRQAFAAEMVPRRDLLNAIALNSASFNAARIVGPAIAGVTLTLWGPAVNFGINAVSYIAVLVGLAMIDPTRLYRAARSAESVPVLRSRAEGFRYAVR